MREGRKGRQGQASKDLEGQSQELGMCSKCTGEPLGCPDFGKVIWLMGGRNRHLDRLFSEPEAPQQAALKESRPFLSLTGLRVPKSLQKHLRTPRPGILLRDIGTP